MASKLPIIVAHRGLHHEHPENSHAAFRAAWDAGFQWAECDVRLDRSGFMYVLHDETLDRTTDGTGPIAGLDWRELRQVRLRDGGGQITNELLPSLGAIRDYMPSDRGLLVELKVKVPAGISVQRQMMHRNWMYQSFDRDEVERVVDERRMGTHYRVPCALLLDQSTDASESLSSTCDALHLHHELVDAAFVAAARSANKAVGVWTVNDERDIRRCIKLGVDMIITDEPELARRLVSGVPA